MRAAAWLHFGPMPLKIALLAVAMIATPALAGSKRSTAAKHEFQRLNPCPANGARRGSCAGWVIDHVTPICAGGEDHASNMQWQTVADAKMKDREEMRMCRSLRK